MKALTKRAESTFRALVRRCARAGASHRINDCPDAYQSVVVERIWTTKYGPLYSIAHYYESNSDLVPDPDVTFLDTGPGMVFPISFQNSLCNDHPIQWDHESGVMVCCGRKEQAGIASFANIWMSNIAAQHSKSVARLKTMEPA